MEREHVELSAMPASDPEPGIGYGSLRQMWRESE